MPRKQPMQADGGDRAARMPDGVGEAEPSSGGESQGAPYPNPHSGKEREGTPSFDGGQTGRGYEGPGNPNATTDPD